MAMRPGPRVEKAQPGIADEVAGPARRVPAPGAWLGGFGAAPFLVATVLALTTREPIALQTVFALITYGAVVLSFLGGVHWGLAITPSAPDASWLRLGIGVLPALSGWIALLLPVALGLLLLAASFVGLLAYDLAAMRQGFAPPWYFRLRWPLTAIVVLCLLLALLV